MKRNGLLCLMFLFIAAATFGQQTTMTFTKEKGDNIEKQVLVFDDDKLDSHVDALKLPKKIKDELRADIDENYKAGEDFGFHAEEGDNTYTVEIIDGDERVMIYEGKAFPELRNEYNDKPQFFVGGSKAFLGLSYGAFDFKKDAARKNVRGVLVKNVVEGEAAYNAGIEEGDVITKLNGVATPSLSLFKDAVNELQPRDKVVFTVNRNGSMMELESIAGKRTMENFFQGGNQNIFPFHFQEFEVEDLIDMDQFKKLEDFDFKGLNKQLEKLDLEGLKLDELNDQLGDLNIDLESLAGRKAQLGVTIKDYYKGAMINSVQENSGAEKAGLQVNDIIKKVDGKAVNNAAELSALIATKDAGDKVKIQYLRNGKKKKTTVTLTKPETQFFFSREKVND